MSQCNKYHYFIVCFIIMKTISQMNTQLMLLKTNDKAKVFTQQSHPQDLATPAFEGLIHLLELFQQDQGITTPQLESLRKKVKFCSRTIFIALVVKGGDNAHSTDMVRSMFESSYYLGHKIYLSGQELSEVLVSQQVGAMTSYLNSQQHQLFSNDIYSLLGPQFKLSTPYDYSKIISIQLNSPNFEKVVTCLIDFVLTIPQASHLSSEEIFVGCCLLICEKPNSSQLSSLLNTHFADSLQVGHELKTKIKQFFQIINS